MLIDSLLRRTRLLALAAAIGLTGLLMTGCVTETPGNEDARAAEAPAAVATPTPGH